jgi:glycosyltransferase involved in cell wall biosynthesis
MSARILYVGYPLLTVSQNSAGGAEQVLWALEREMARRGLDTVVAASAGSCVSGELFSTGEPCAQLDDFERRNREHQDRIIAFVRQQALERRPFDLVHDMSGSFWVRAAEVEPPVLATLHLPRSFYPAASFENVAANVSFNCVSNSQALSFASLDNMLGVVPNGIALDRFAQAGEGTAGSAKAGLLWLGRICEEKAPHLAFQIARHAGLPLTLAGQVYPFSYHQRYFEREVAPCLKNAPDAVLVNSPSFEQKCRLLRAARALLITSQAAETSSLIAMEAAACGTPVIAFRRGALPEVVRDQVTGFVVEGMEEAVEACARAASISAEACISFARQNFQSAKMAAGYAELYTRITVARRVPAHV